MLAHVLEEQEAAVDAREVFRADEVRHQRQVAAPERARRGELRGTLEFAFHFIAVRAQ